MGYSLFSNTYIFKLPNEFLKTGIWCSHFSSVWACVALPVGVLFW